MANYQIALGKTKAIEGGYANNSSDKGGETYKGISRVNFPYWLGWKIVDQLKPNNTTLAADSRLQELVDSFYKIEFWNRFRGDQIANQEVAEELFDTAVNMGLSAAVTFLQRALNALNLIHKSWPNLVVDGKFGMATFGALDAYLQRVVDAPYLLTLLNCQQGVKYLNIAEADESQEIFMRGWLKRVVLTKAIT